LAAGLIKMSEMGYGINRGGVMGTAYTIGERANTPIHSMEAGPGSKAS